MADIKLSMPIVQKQTVKYMLNLCHFMLVYIMLCFNDVFEKFQVYINYVNLVVNLLVPTATLSIMNCLIYRALRQNQAQANQVKNYYNNGGGQTYRSMSLPFITKRCIK